MSRRHPPSTAPATRIVYRVEGGLASIAFRLLGALPLDLASALGGRLARLIGPALPVSRRALRNLERALPELDPAARQRVVREMWENLGRVVAEYPHLPRIRCFGEGRRVIVEGTEHVDRALAAQKPLIFFSGHFGNWELLALAAAQYGLRVAAIYRAANNPAVEQVMQALRRSLGVEPISKGAAGARRAIAALRQGKALGMLVDQKMNDGIAVPFFGRDAWTAPAVAELALKYGCTLLPARVDRLGGARFRLTVMPPLELAPTGDRPADVHAAMARINRLLESWIREAPGHWFWVHRRWPDS